MIIQPTHSRETRGSAPTAKNSASSQEISHIVKTSRYRLRAFVLPKPMLCFPRPSLVACTHLAGQGHSQQSSRAEDMEGDHLHRQKRAVAPRGLPTDVGAIAGTDREPPDRQDDRGRWRGERLANCNHLLRQSSRKQAVDADNERCCISKQPIFVGKEMVFPPAPLLRSWARQRPLRPITGYKQRRIGYDVHEERACQASPPSISLDSAEPFFVFSPHPSSSIRL